MGPVAPTGSPSEGPASLSSGRTELGLGTGLASGPPRWDKAVIVIIWEQLRTVL